MYFYHVYVAPPPQCLYGWQRVAKWEHRKDWRKDPDFGGFSPALQYLQAEAAARTVFHCSPTRIERYFSAKPSESSANLLFAFDYIDLHVTVFASAVSLYRREIHWWQYAKLDGMGREWKIVTVKGTPPSEWKNLEFEIIDPHMK